MFSLFELVWKRIRLFFTDDEVFYIGGADVLPPPLEREQENRCLIALSGLHGDSEPMTREDARKQLIEHNLRLVVYLARKFENTGICVEDLISIGTIGLIKSINTFNPEKNIKLATYASRCIENEILMYFRGQKKSAQDVSLSDYIETGTDGAALSLMDVVSEDGDLLEQVSSRESAEQLHRAIRSCLTEQEREVVVLRYGLNGKPPKRQREVAIITGISRSYVSRIEKRALQKLRKELEE